MAETTHINWTYKRKLKLESTLLMMSHPAMCMDSSPIAGLTVYLQHQMLSYRKIKLNPLNNKYNSSKSKLTKEDLFDDLDEDTLITSKLSNKLQRDSSMMTVCFVWFIHIIIFNLIDIVVQNSLQLGNKSVLVLWSPRS